MKNIEDNSIDMILCDLPYGVTNRNKWDCIIPFDKLWIQYNRILKKNGAVVLTSIQPFTTTLISSNIQNFKYEWIWRKQQGTGFLNAKKQPLRNHESICVFYRSQPIYNPQFTEGKPYTCKSGVGSMNYGEQEQIVTKNDGTRYPLTVLDFPYDKNKLHPTQKPLALFEYLIKTYTNEGDLVLDSCVGAGTTNIAAFNTDRKCVGIEKDEKYYEIAVNRLNDKMLNTVLKP